MVWLAQDRCKSMFEIDCDVVFPGQMLSKRMKRSLANRAVLTQRRCVRSGSRAEIVYLVVGRGNVFVNSSDLHIARVWIQMIARPE